jgi:hypothetical protein
MSHHHALTYWTEHAPFGYDRDDAEWRTRFGDALVLHTLEQGEGGPRPEGMEYLHADIPPAVADLLVLAGRVLAGAKPWPLIELVEAWDALTAEQVGRRIWHYGEQLQDEQQIYPGAVLLDLAEALLHDAARKRLASADTAGVGELVVERNDDEHPDG